MKTVKELRQAGFTVKVRHNRIARRIITLNPLTEIYPGGFESKGGSTEVNIYDPSGKLITKGEAHCCGNDNYNRRIGLDIALGRALSKIIQIDGELFSIKQQQTFLSRFFNRDIS